MQDKPELFSERLARIEQELLTLRKRIEWLESGPGFHRQADNQAGSRENLQEFSPDGVLDWVGQSWLLPRISTVCFLLFIALALRTLTDKAIITLAFGSLLGISYASGIILVGFLRYRRQHPLAPIFLGCGSILLFSILLEAHGKFGWLSSGWVYALLAGTAVVLSAAAVLQQQWLPGILGVPGAAVAAAAVDFPDPFFPPLIVLLVGFNILACAIRKVKGCGGASWPVLLLTLCMTEAWAEKSMLHAGTTSTGSRAEFIMVIVVAGITYFFIALYQALVRKEDEKQTVFAAALPSINALWLFVMLQGQGAAFSGGTTGLALSGTAAGAVHLGTAMRSRQKGFRQIDTSFLTGGILFLALWLPRLIGLPLSLVVTAVAAFAGFQADNRGARFIARLAALYCALTLAFVTYRDVAPSLDSCIPGIILAVLFLLQYINERGRAPAGSGGRVVLLSVSLLCGFLALREFASWFLAAVLTMPDWSGPLAAFECAVINLSAPLMLAPALKSRDKELRTAAIGILVLGGVKAIISMITMRGIAVLVCVLSFGLAVSTQSFIMARWRGLTDYEKR